MDSGMRFFQMKVSLTPSWSEVWVERNLVIDKRLKNLTPITNIKGTVNTDGIRRMTPREWARLQGFDDSFLIPVSDAQAYKQFGNSVAVPAIAATAQKLLEALRRI